MTAAGESGRSHTIKTTTVGKIKYRLLYTGVIVSVAISVCLLNAILYPIVERFPEQVKLSRDPGKRNLHKVIVLGC